jgi:hypothetical protein
VSYKLGRTLWQIKIVSKQSPSPKVGCVLLKYSFKVAFTQRTCNNKQSMTIVRKIIGLLIILFFALPSLFVAIWAVGATRAIVSKDFLVNLPKELIKQVPDLIDLSFQVAQQQPQSIKDKNGRLWVEAITKTKPTPRQLLDEVGILSWLEKDVPPVFDQIGNALEGKQISQNINLDTRPLKQGLENPVVDNYITQVFQKLPNCDKSQQALWETALTRENKLDNLPACQPSQLVVQQLLTKIKEQTAAMPDKTLVFSASSLPTSSFNIILFITLIVSLIFIAPLIFILLGSLIASSSLSSFLRWSGLTTLIGGLLVFVSAWLPQNAVYFALRINPPIWKIKNSTVLSPELNQQILEKFGNIFIPLLAQIFSSVVYISLIVCAIGLVLVGLSFLTRPTKVSQAPLKNEPPKEKAPVVKKLATGKKKKNTKASKDNIQTS